MCALQIFIIIIISGWGGNRQHFWIFYWLWLVTRVSVDCAVNACICFAWQNANQFANQNSRFSIKNEYNIKSVSMSTQIMLPSLPG